MFLAYIKLIISALFRTIYTILTILQMFQIKQSLQCHMFFLKVYIIHFVSQHSTETLWWPKFFLKTNG